MRPGFRTLLEWGAIGKCARCRTARPRMASGIVYRPQMRKSPTLRTDGVGSRDLCHAPPLRRHLRPAQGICTEGGRGLCLLVLACVLVEAEPLFKMGPAGWTWPCTRTRAIGTSHRPWRSSSSCWQLLKHPLCAAGFLEGSPSLALLFDFADEPVRVERVDLVQREGLEHLRELVRHLRALG